MKAKKSISTTIALHIFLMVGINHTGLEGNYEGSEASCGKDPGCNRQFLQFQGCEPPQGINYAAKLIPVI